MAPTVRRGRLSASRLPATEPGRTRSARTPKGLNGKLAVELATRRRLRAASGRRNSDGATGCRIAPQVRQDDPAPSAPSPAPSSCRDAAVTHRRTVNCRLTNLRRESARRPPWATPGAHAGRVWPGPDAHNAAAAYCRALRCSGRLQSLVFRAGLPAAAAAWRSGPRSNRRFPAGAAPHPIRCLPKFSRTTLPTTSTDGGSGVRAASGASCPAVALTGTGAAAGMGSGACINSTTSLALTLT